MQSLCVFVVSLHVLLARSVSIGMFCCFFPPSFLSLIKNNQSRRQVWKAILFGVYVDCVFGSLDGCPGWSGHMAECVWPNSEGVLHNRDLWKDMMKMKSGKGVSRCKSDDFFCLVTMVVLVQNPNSLVISRLFPLLEMLDRDTKCYKFFYVMSCATRFIFSAPSP